MSRPQLLLPFFGLLFAPLAVPVARADAGQGPTPAHTGQWYLVDGLDPERLSVVDRALIDSTLRHYHEAANDTARLFWLDHLVLQCQDVEVWPRYNSILLEQARMVARTAKDAVFRSRARNYELSASANLGVLHTERGRLDSALITYQKSLAIAVELKDRAQEATLLNNLGDAYRKQGDITNALENLARSLQVRQAIGDTAGLAMTYVNLGSLHRQQKNLPMAEDYYSKALVLYRAAGDLHGEATALNNLGVVASNREDVRTAGEYWREALRLYERMGSRSGVALEHNNLGMMHQKLGDKASALAEFRQALAGYAAIGNRGGMALAHFNSGRVYLNLGDPRNALRHGEEGLQLAKTSGEAERIWQNAELLRDAYAHMRDWKQAYAMEMLFRTMGDSISNETAERAAIQQKYAFEYAQRALLDSLAHQEDRAAAERVHQHVVHRKEQQRDWSVVGAVITVLLAFALWSRLRYTRRTGEIIRKERDRSDELLNNILPEEVAAELKANGRAHAKHFEQATILFTDFKGFTAVAERLSPEDLVEELNVCFNAFDDIITSRGIEKIKTIGDAYMCVGGMPDPNASSAADVVRAALEMQRFMEERRAGRERHGLPFFEMRVGVHTGPVVAGIVGVKKFQYDIWGDTVNTASRMESSGEVGKVNISGTTYALVKDEAGFAFDPRGRVRAKGKGELEMYFVNGSSQRRAA